ncbi:MAG: MopE-related protein [Myxococcota bacterium]
MRRTPSLLLLACVSSLLTACDDGHYAIDIGIYPTVTPMVETPTATPAEHPSPTPTPEQTPPMDQDGDGYNVQTDCDDLDPNLYPGAPERPYDGIDQDCSGTDLIDVDGDGFSSVVVGGDDCNDYNASIFPTQSETADGLDNNCSGAADENTEVIDDDGDGFNELAGDCDDANPSRFPGAAEVPYDQVDQDCDGADLADVDRDGVPGGAEGADCDDYNAAISPRMPEQCNGSDDNCDGQVDEALEVLSYEDRDQDGFGNSNRPVKTCDSGFQTSTQGGDCNDSSSSIHPGASESCDGQDNDCNGTVDDNAGNLFYQDRDGDLQGNLAVTSRGCTLPSGFVANSRDCNDQDPAIYSGAPERCNGIDDDCDQLADEDIRRTVYPDQDGDGYGLSTQPSQDCMLRPGFVDNGADCDDTSSAIRPGALELCNGIDDDCDGAFDDGYAQRTYFRDMDEDGYGNHSLPLSACAPPDGYVERGDDCNDADAKIYPDADEQCDALDNDCDGKYDEEVTTLYYLDTDGDGFGVNDVTFVGCAAPAGFSASSGDCNDGEAQVNPGVAEDANLEDDNCNGQVDEGVYFKSCAELHSADPSAPSGAYVLDVDGVEGAMPPRSIWCEMSRDGGGWTLCASFGHQRAHDGLGFTTETWSTGSFAFLSGGSVTSWGNFCPELSVNELYVEMRSNPKTTLFTTGLFRTLGENPFTLEGFSSYGNGEKDVVAFYNRSSAQPRGQFFSGIGCGTQSSLASQGSALCVSDGTAYQTMVGDKDGNDAADDWMNTLSSIGGMDEDNALLYFVR